MFDVTLSARPSYFVISLRPSSCPQGDSPPLQDLDPPALRVDRVLFTAERTPPWTPRSRGYAAFAALFFFPSVSPTAAAFKTWTFRTSGDLRCLYTERVSISKLLPGLLPPAFPFPLIETCSPILLVRARASTFLGKRGRILQIFFVPGRSPPFPYAPLFFSPVPVSFRATLAV